MEHLGYVKLLVFRTWSYNKLLNVLLKRLIKGKLSGVSTLCKDRKDHTYALFKTKKMVHALLNISSISKDFLYLPFTAKFYHLTNMSCPFPNYYYLYHYITFKPFGSLDSVSVSTQKIMIVTQLIK